MLFQYLFTTFVKTIQWFKVRNFHWQKLSLAETFAGRNFSWQKLSPISPTAKLHFADSEEKLRLFVRLGKITVNTYAVNKNILKNFAGINFRGKGILKSFARISFHGAKKRKTAKVSASEGFWYKSKRDKNKPKQKLWND